MKQKIPIGLDTETTGLNFKTKKLLSVQWFTDRGYVLTKSEQYKGLKKDLEDPDRIKIIQNFAFDGPFLQEHTDIVCQNIWDTKVMESIIHGVGSGFEVAKDLRDQFGTSLDVILKRRGIALLNKSVRESFIGHVGKLTKQQTEYALEDVKYLNQLMIDQKSDIERLGLERLAELENQVVEVVAHMKFYGIGFDESIWLSIANKYSKLYLKEIDKLPKHISWTSEKQVKKFFGRKGIVIQSYKDLEGMRGQDSILDQFLLARQYYANYKTFGESWLFRTSGKVEEPTVDTDGRIRCNFEQILKTGRFSSSYPNLQNIPALTVSEHRTAFVPRKGWSFVIGDFTGQELGIMAVGANEPSWIKAMLNNEDVHSVTAKLLYGDVWDKVTDNDCSFPLKCNCKGHKPLRRNAKDLNFGLAYGKGAQALALDLNITNDEAYKLIRTYKSKIPNITKWLTKNGADADEYRETFTMEPFRRRRSLELEPESWRRINQGKNTPVQGTGGDILKVALVKLFQYITKNNLVGNKVIIVHQVHDEIITEVKDQYVKTWIPVMKVLMEQAAMVVTKLNVIKVEPFSAKYWAKEK